MGIGTRFLGGFVGARLAGANSREAAGFGFLAAFWKWIAAAFVIACIGAVSISHRPSSDLPQGADGGSDDIFGKKEASETKAARDDPGRPTAADRDLKAVSKELDASFKGSD